MVLLLRHSLRGLPPTPPITRGVRECIPDFFISSNFVSSATKSLVFFWDAYGSQESVQNYDFSCADCSNQSSKTPDVS